MELRNIDFISTPKGCVEVRPMNGESSYILTEISRDLISPMKEIIRERYPKAFSNLCKRYEKSKENTWYYDFQIVQGFIKCNMGSYDNKVDIDAEGNFHFEFIQCPLAGECPEWRETCFPKENLSISKAELRVLELIKDGKKVNDISEILCISRFTAENHQNNMLRKLGYHNNAQLVDYYHKHVAQSVE